MHRKPFFSYKDEEENRKHERTQISLLNSFLKLVFSDFAVSSERSSVVKT